jgi:predicted Zn-ribbon and HTH transcriptional regulator
MGDKAECVYCGNVWTPRTKLPKQCPNCKKLKWWGEDDPPEIEPKKMTCPNPLCKYTWVYRTEKPKQCPKCRSDLEETWPVI